MILRLLASMLAVVASAGLSDATCPGTTIPGSSDRTASSPCPAGALGTECPFQCDEGFLKIGRHVCQSYTTAKGQVVLDHAFFGGRCEKLCQGSPSTCPAGSVPIRYNTTSSTSSCFATECAASQDEALRRVVRGSYELFALGRDPATGIYSGTVDATAPASAQMDRAHIGVNGLGMMSECIAAELGFQTVEEAGKRVNLTLSGESDRLSARRSKCADA